MNNDKHFVQQITLEDMKREVEREIKVRQRVYPNWIEQGKISKTCADYRILVLEAVAIQIELLIHEKSPQRNLFERSDEETF